MVERTEEGEGESDTGAGTCIQRHSFHQIMGEEESDTGGLLTIEPYEDTLEYLDDKFQMLAVMVQAEENRTKAQVKQAGGQHTRGYSYSNEDKAVSLRELEGKRKYLTGMARIITNPSTQSYLM